MITHLAVLAGSCYPNCTPPPGSHFTTGPAGTGSAALGFAFIGVIVLFLMRKK